MSEFIGIVAVIMLIVVIPILLICLVVRALSKKPLEKIIVSLCVCCGSIIPLTILGVLTSPTTWCEHNDTIISETSPTCSEKGSIVYVCDKCEQERTDSVDKLEHDMQPIDTGLKCSTCGYEEITEPVETADIEPVEKTYIEGVSFDEIYRAYKENELRADETYRYNRYRITGKVNGMTNDGLLNLTGGAMLTMEKLVGNTIVFFYAEFDRHQEEDLKLINVGDTITFEGKCLSAGSWTDCKIIKE